MSFCFDSNSSKKFNSLLFATTQYGVTSRDKALYLDVGGIKAVTGDGKALHIDVCGLKSVTRHGKGANHKFFWLEVGKNKHTGTQP